MTIAFSDVQASTNQWGRFPEVMSVAMEEHNAIMRDKLRLAGGYEVKTEGNKIEIS